MKDGPANGIRLYVNRDDSIFQQSISNTKLQRIRKVRNIFGNSKMPMNEDIAAMEIFRLRVTGDQDNPCDHEFNLWYFMFQLTIYSARTCKVGTVENADYSENTSLMTLGRNQKQFTLNYTPISLSEEAYQW